MKTLTPGDVMALRAAYSLTQSELAALVDVDARTVLRWEHGTAVPGGPAADLLWVLDRAARSEPQRLALIALLGTVIVGGTLRELLALAFDTLLGPRGDVP